MTRFRVTPAAAVAALGRGPISLGLAMFLSACAVGPDYQRPEVDLPKDFGVAQAPTPAPATWWTLFNDPVLDKLVEEALQHNRDLRAAAYRIDQARAQFTIERAALTPDAGVGFDASRQKSSQLSNFPVPPEFLESSSHRLVLRTSWEIDFWGKFRRATEAARAELAASEAGREAVRATLIGEVVRGYFTLRALDRRLEFLELTREGWLKASELQKLRLDAGLASELDFHQVDSNYRAAAARVPVARQQRAAQEGLLAVLLGRSPREVFAAQVPRGDPATPERIEVPAGLPSDLLLRRPDLREAEERLHAANARIGVARAAYFPRITLTAFYGGESTDLSDLFSGPARTWNVAGALLQPLFAGGQIRGGVELADARTKEAAEMYQKAIANAFREVREALAAQTNLREAHLAQLEHERSLARTAELAKLRYDNGAVSLFEVLEAERQRVAATIEMIDAERQRRSAIVDLYLALGA